jgi:hypothetical protein
VAPVGAADLQQEEDVAVRRHVMVRDAGARGRGDLGVPALHQPFERGAVEELTDLARREGVRRVVVVAVEGLQLAEYRLGHGPNVGRGLCARRRDLERHGEDGAHESGDAHAVIVSRAC